ncbi:MAG: hydrogenase iron-sulfur subunit [Deltaproteobacteria bacterium]|nr:hydrogenase iron-sulfur subunit [Deltaproteobacteria bacterium]
MVQTLESRETLKPPTEIKEWQPRIVAMVCNWCTYAGADMAGTARRAYASNVRVVRFLCTGRMDPLFIVKAFEQGADGVLISGCHPGDCHYVQGNLLARRRFTVFRALMDFLGLDNRRLQFAWVSASEGAKWSRIVDQVTASVREAGPLNDWGRSVMASSGRSALSIGSAADPEPRVPPSPEETWSISEHLQQLAADLLNKGEVSTLLGYSQGGLPGQMVPTFVTNPEQVSTLAWNERCANNLAVYLPEALKKKGKGKIAMVVKSCDAKAVMGLMRENQLKREDVLLLGIPCAGVWENGKLALKCHSCRSEVSPSSDWTVTRDGAHKGVAPSEAERKVGVDPRDEQIRVLESFSSEERRKYWQQQFDRCLRCYACRAVCPLCYCSVCISDKHRPQWIPTSFGGKGNTAWNIARVMHLAGRCTGCDECTRVCPAGIRLDLLNRRLAREAETRFNYRVEEDPNSIPPLTTFRPDDPDEFL